MMQSLLLLASLASLASAIDPPPAGMTWVDCKHYQLCCDNNICTNNCRLRPSCADAFNQPAPWGPIGQMICEGYFQYTCCRDADGCGDPVSIMPGVRSC